MRLIHSAIAGVDVASCAGHACSPPAGQASPCGGGVCLPLGDDYACQCPLGRAGVTCEKAVDLVEAVPSFGGDSYLFYDDKDMAKRYVRCDVVRRRYSSRYLLPAFWVRRRR